MNDNVKNYRDYVFFGTSGSHDYLVERSDDARRFWPSSSPVTPLTDDQLAIARADTEEIDWAEFGDIDDEVDATLALIPKSTEEAQSIIDAVERLLASSVDDEDAVPRYLEATSAKTVPCACLYHAKGVVDGE